MRKAYHQERASDTMAQIQKCLDCKHKECNNCMRYAAEKHKLYNAQYYQRKKEQNKDVERI